MYIVMATLCCVKDFDHQYLEKQHFRHQTKGITIHFSSIDSKYAPVCNLYPSIPPLRVAQWCSCLHILQTAQFRLIVLREML